MNFSKTNHPLWDINISNMKKIILADMANSSWVKALKEYVSSKNQEDGVDAKLPDID
jgi:hypothetical protein|nr:MAG TPA: hypothetical protein [Caudoviricetes sp.]